MIDAYRKVLKRILDLVLTVPALILASPLMACIAVAIKLDSPGPILFRQERLGQNGNVFTMLKFRSMVVGAGNGMVQNSRRDPRVTRVGAFLRKWSLDELPQLYNVLKGDMSLVGPRPDRVFRWPEYAEFERIRLRVRPGITGWSQVNGRNMISWEERYKLDAEYVQNWSLRLDLAILIRTMATVLRREGIDAS